MYEAYRVVKPFEWRGWHYAPNPLSGCGCNCGELRKQPDGGMMPLLRCVNIVASSCDCKKTTCRCTCGILEERYGGDIWLVEEGHSRKDWMLYTRYATGDGSLLPVDDLLEQEKYRVLTSPWKPGLKELVGA